MIKYIQIYSKIHPDSVFGIFLLLSDIFLIVCFCEITANFNVPKQKQKSPQSISNSSFFRCMLVLQILLTISRKTFSVAFSVLCVFVSKYAHKYAHKRQNFCFNFHLSSTPKPLQKCKTFQIYNGLKIDLFKKKHVFFFKYIFILVYTFLTVFLSICAYMCVVCVFLNAFIVIHIFIVLLSTQLIV